MKFKLRVRDDWKFLSGRRPGATNLVLIIGTFASSEKHVVGDICVKGVYWDRQIQDDHHGDGGPFVNNWEPGIFTLW